MDENEEALEVLANGKLTADTLWEMVSNLRNDTTYLVEACSYIQTVWWHLYGEDITEDDDLMSVETMLHYCGMVEIKLDEITSPALEQHVVRTRIVLRKLRRGLDNFKGYGKALYKGII